MNPFMMLMIGCTLFSAVSQLLLKKSADKTYPSKIREYLNVYVITGYLIFGAVLILNTIAYTRVDMKYGAVIDTLTYVFVLIFSSVFLKEKITKGKLIGNLVIIAGVLIYTM